MDTKVTLSFDKRKVEKAKIYAQNNNISLSRLVEHLQRQTTNKTHQKLEDLPVADWVNMVAEGNAEYSTKPKSRKAMKNEVFNLKA
jgi:hypothetical protein